MLFFCNNVFHFLTTDRFVNFINKSVNFKCVSRSYEFVLPIPDPFNIQVVTYNFNKRMHIDVLQVLVITFKGLNV